MLMGSKGTIQCLKDHQVINNDLIPVLLQLAKASKNAQFDNHLVYERNKTSNMKIEHRIVSHGKNKTKIARKIHIHTLCTHATQSNKDTFIEKKKNPQQPTD